MYYQVLQTIGIVDILKKELGFVQVLNMFSLQRLISTAHFENRHQTINVFQFQKLSIIFFQKCTCCFNFKFFNQLFLLVNIFHKVNEYRFSLGIKTTDTEIIN